MTPNERTLIEIMWTSLTVGWSEIGVFLYWMRDAFQPDPSAPTTFDSVGVAVFGGLLVFYENPPLLIVAAVGAFVLSIVLRKKAQQENKEL